jgi:GNAT superfamily N-acetyltransferase
MLITYIINHPDHYATVADWYMSFWGKNYPDRTKTDWEAYIGKYADKLPMTLIALDDSTNPFTPIGTASIRLNGMDNCPLNTAWLSGVYVPPEHRGKGVATSLIKEALKITSKQYNQLYLFTRTDGRIYKNLGWQTTSEIEYQGSQVSVMQNLLVPKIEWQFYAKTQPKEQVSLPEQKVSDSTVSNTNQKSYTS